MRQEPSGCRRKDRQRHGATGELAVCLTFVVGERERVRPSDPREARIARDLIDDAVERQDFRMRAIGGPSVGKLTCRSGIQNGGVVRMSGMSGMLRIALYRDAPSHHEPN